MLLQWKYSVKIKSLFKITILIIFNSKAILVGQQFNKISDQQWKKFKKEPLQNLSQWRKRWKKVANLLIENTFPQSLKRLKNLFHFR